MRDPKSPVQGGSHPAQHRHVPTVQSTQREISHGQRLRAAAHDEYVVHVADDVDNIRGELVKPRGTLNGHVPSVRRWLVLVAGTELGLTETVLRATGARR